MKSAKQVLQQSGAGTYLGTGAAINVNLGFKPRLLIIVNETDGDAMWLAIDGLADGYAVQITTAVSLLSSNGITLTEQGFSVGTSLSESGDTHRYYAI